MLFLAKEPERSFRFSDNPDLDGDGVSDRPAPGHSDAVVIINHNVVNLERHVQDADDGRPFRIVFAITGCPVSRHHRFVRRRPRRNTWHLTRDNLVWWPGVGVPSKYPY